MNRLHQWSPGFRPCLLGITFFALASFVYPKAQSQPDTLANTMTGADHLPVAIPCWDANTTQDEMNDYIDNILRPFLEEAGVGNGFTEALLGNQNRERGANYFLGGRWSGPQGSPRNITWSFVPDGLWIPSGVGEPGANSDLFSRMDALFGSRTLWIQQFQNSFDRWAELSGLTYTWITYGGNDWDDGAAWGASGSSTRGDIRIAMKNIDGSSGILGYSSLPSGGGDTVLDRSEGWNSSSGTYRFLRNVVMHEHGHGIGMYHVCPTNSSKLMEPLISLNYDGLQHDDIRGAQEHYGDIYETDNSYADATDLGVISPGPAVIVGLVPSPTVVHGSTLGIDYNGEQDWFRFTVDSAVLMTATAFPVGLNYDSSPQSGGTCTSGNFVNSLAIADLIMEARSGPTGGTILATADDFPAGTPETLSSVLLSSAGDYYIRVNEGNVPTDTQLYRLEITVVSADVPPQIDVQPVSISVCEGEAATFTVVASGTGTLTYQWKKDGIPISGETSSTLVIDPAIEADEGDYTCEVCNTYGCVESDLATLTVITDADCQDGEFCNGDEVCVSDGNCGPGIYPCPGQFCDEVNDECYVPPGPNPTLSIEIVEVNGSDVGSSPSSSEGVAPGDIVTVELFVRDWSPNGEHLRGYQTQIDSTGYTSGSAGDIFPRDWAITTDLNGRCSAGGPDGVSNPDNVFIDVEDCFANAPSPPGEPDPAGSDIGPWGIFSPCTWFADCLPGSGICEAPSIDWVFGQVTTGTQSQTNSVMCDHRHIGAADVGLDGPISIQDGTKYYLGTVVLEASSDADGTFTLCLDNTDVQPPLGSPDNSFISDENNDQIMPTLIECATITVGVEQCPYGDVDGNGEANLVDMLCMLDGLSGLFTCPGVTFENMDIWPCLGGDGDLNLNDLLAMLDALRGLPPCPCP